MNIAIVVHAKNDDSDSLHGFLIRGTNEELLRGIFRTPRHFLLLGKHGVTPPDMEHDYVFGQIGENTDINALLTDVREMCVNLQLQCDDVKYMAHDDWVSEVLE